MEEGRLSARQLSVAVLVGGLSAAAAAAGRLDWRWALVTVPLTVLVGWLLLRRIKGRPLYRGAGGVILLAVYGSVAVLLMARALERAAARIQITAGSDGVTGWLLLLLTVPLLWMSWGKAAAFLRAAEIFWLAMAVVLAGIVVLSLPRVEWRYLWPAMGGLRESVLTTVEIMGTGLFVLPYIYKVTPQPGSRRKALGWISVLGGVTVLLAVLTAGVLSPAVAGELETPFFVMTGLLGDSSRGEGLISALWLLADLTYIGLLARSLVGKYLPTAATVLAFGFALTGAAGSIPALLLPCLMAGAVLLTLVLPLEKGKIVVEASG